MQQVRSQSPRRDPAPTRLAYRLNRLWLTPLFRKLLRVGLPVFCILFALGWFLSDEVRRDDLVARVAEMRRAIEERPEFMVKLMAIDGASDEVAQDIREIAEPAFPVSSFDLDLEEMRRSIAGLDAVAKADVRIKAGGILKVRVTEREPAVIWRGRQGLELLDATGHRVAALAHLTMRADLPLIAGDGADANVGEAMELLEAAR
ncbi:MAG: FtsQ-type POTRA domain-containing protein, partial [Paracoccaceae bacterium]